MIILLRILSRLLGLYFPVNIGMHHFARPFGSAIGLMHSIHQFLTSRLLRVLWSKVENSINNMALCEYSLLLQTLLLFQSAI